MKSENVVILGASDKPDRYSYKAFKLLAEYGHQSYLVHPTLASIEGHACYPNLKSIKALHVSIDTLTLYVNPDISSKMEQEIIDLRPRRVIFNPGTENTKLMKALNEAKIPYEEACTLVLLKTGQFC